MYLSAALVDFAVLAILLLAATYGRLLDRPSPCVVQDARNRDVVHCPVTEKLAQKRAEKDGDDDVPVVVHCQQHHDIRHAKCRRMECRSDELLKRSRSECCVLWPWST